jgi:hypothetical protein
MGNFLSKSYEVWILVSILSTRLLDHKSKPLKKTLLPLVSACLVFFSCKKENLVRQEIIAEAFSAPCLFQTVNPTGHSYDASSVIEVTYSGKHCGFMPLSSMNYWVYEDSVFENGVFQHVQFDTLRYNKAYESQPDQLIWWESNISLGLPDKLYSSDSALFRMQDRLFTPDILDVKKDFFYFTGDSVKYLASFDDIAAQGRSIKMSTPFTTPAGTFNEWILFEKNARNYRKDQVYFRPGLGVIRYTVEKAIMGQRELLLQQISTLVAFHIE